MTVRHTANIKTATVNKVAGLSKQAERDALARDFGLESFTPQPGMIYTRVRAISARVNRNFDGFESSELKRAYATFEGRPVFVNHENHDPTRTRGIVVASAYREDNDDRYIELLIEVDAQAFPKLAQEIADGNIDSVSMGCEVEYTICSYCGNEADDLGDFCEHVLHHKGQTLQRAAANGEIEDVLVYEICRGVNFFEISFVFDPADETALAQTVLDARTARRKRAYDDRVAPQQVDTLTNSDPCPACGAEDFNGTQCRWCDYVTPPKELQDPDTSKAKEYDLRNEPEDDHGDTPNTDQEDHIMPRTAPDREDARRRAAQRRLAHVNNLIAARRKRAGVPPVDGWDQVPGGLVNQTNNRVRIIQDPDTGMYDLEILPAGPGGPAETVGTYATLEEAVNDGTGHVMTLTARRRARAARRNTINREVSMNRRTSTARRKRANVLQWEEIGHGFEAESPEGVLYTVEEIGGPNDVDVFADGVILYTVNSLDEGKAKAEDHASGKTARRRPTASRKRAGLSGSEDAYSNPPSGWTNDFGLIVHNQDEGLSLEESLLNGNLVWWVNAWKDGISYAVEGPFGTIDEAASAAQEYVGRSEEAASRAENRYAARRKRASLAWDQVASDVASAYDGKGHYIEVWYHQDEGWDYAIYTDTDGGREMTVPRGSSPMFDTLEEAKSAAESAVQGLTTASRKRATRRKQASELEPDEIPAYFPVKPLATQAEIDAAGDPVQDGECGLWWDDAISTSLTPAPGGRCPFEEYHDYDDDGYYARRKRADADTDAAQPDERADLDETGDPVNSNADEEAAKPDERVDVTTPDETQPADAADSQYDPDEYENQGGAPVKASSMQALALVEAYEEHGIITNDERLAKFAELEKTSATIVQDRLDLLAQVKAAGAKAPTRTAKRSTVPRSATPQRPTPSMGRAASTGDTQLPDYLITL